MKGMVAYKPREILFLSLVIYMFNEFNYRDSFARIIGSSN